VRITHSPAYGRETFFSGLSHRIDFRGGISGLLTSTPALLAGNVPIACLRGRAGTLDREVDRLRTCWHQQAARRE
jgi:hypothetical protein